MIITFYGDGLFVFTKDIMWILIVVKTKLNVQFHARSKVKHQGWVAIHMVFEIISNKVHKGHKLWLHRCWRLTIHFYDLFKLPKFLRQITNFFEVKFHNLEHEKLVIFNDLSKRIFFKCKTLNSDITTLLIQTLTNATKGAKPSNNQKWKREVIKIHVYNNCLPKNSTHRVI